MDTAIDEGTAQSTDPSSPIAAAHGKDEITRAFQTRHLPSSIIVPEIKCEMQLLRPVRLEDLEAMDELDAFAHSSRITGYSQKAERAIVGTWVHDSVAWSMGDVDVLSAIEARGYERTIGWTMMTRISGSVDPDELRPIGMIFLTSIDAWSRDARLQVILGRDFRSRGYSRDAMPRVMTFGFGPTTANDGLGLHRISTFVPGFNQRSLSVYQSIGFTLEGVLRDKLWDDENDEYQDLNILSTLADEYDPIRALDAWGMRIIPGNPGVKEALAAHGHSVALQKQTDLRAVADSTASSETFKTPADFHDARAVAGEPEKKRPINPRDASPDADRDAWQQSEARADRAAGGRPRWQAAQAAVLHDGGEQPSAGVDASSDNHDQHHEKAGDSADGEADVATDGVGADGVTRHKSKRAWWRRWFHGEASAREEDPSPEAQTTPSKRSAHGSSHASSPRSQMPSGPSDGTSSAKAGHGRKTHHRQSGHGDGAQSADTAKIAGASSTKTVDKPSHDAR